MSRAPVLFLLLALSLAFSRAPRAGGAVPVATAPVVAPSILGERPHDQSLFTQGLFAYQGRLYESAGMRGRSRLLIADPDTSAPIAVHRLASRFFAEGADLCGREGRREVVQLTWTSGTAFRYHPESLRKIGEFRYQGEGWGLACDGERVVTSDGSATLTFRDPLTFAPLSTVRVTDHGRPIRWLNELEWLDGLLLANVWKRPRIAVIDPATGAVRLWLDMTEAVRRSGRSGEFVLNGIAWDAAHARLYVTGKGWDRLFLVDRAWTEIARESGARVANR